MRGSNDTSAATSAWSNRAETLMVKLKLAAYYGPDITTLDDITSSLDQFFQETRVLCAKITTPSPS